MIVYSNAMLKKACFTSVETWPRLKWRHVEADFKNCAWCLCWPLDVSVRAAVNGNLVVSKRLQFRLQGFYDYYWAKDTEVRSCSYVLERLRPGFFFPYNWWLGWKRILCSYQMSGFRLCQKGWSRFRYAIWLCADGFGSWVLCKLNGPCNFVWK